MVGAGGPENPFEPPESDAEPARLDVEDAISAEPGVRLGAAMLDGLLAMVALSPSLIAMFTRGSFAEAGAFWWVGKDPLQLISSAAWIGLILFQAYLVSTTGQTVGKRLLGIRIVRMDGAPLDFVHGVLIRNWAIMALNYVPYIGGILGLVDVLYIFRGDRRCLHDHLAGTKVILGK